MISSLLIFISFYLTAANQIQESDLEKVYAYLFTFLIVVLTITINYFPKFYKNFPNWISNFITEFRGKITSTSTPQVTGDEDLDKAIEAAGYCYDSVQDIFYSGIDAWQRSVGYCRLYDEMAAPMGMIIDCEPVYFEYDRKKWLIEFWKGQYDLTTGCEIGVYSTADDELIIPGIFNGTFYNCVENKDCLKMSCTLKKNGDVLFKRSAKHWWLTGFKLGEFSEPSELSVELSITLKDAPMCKAFVKGLKNTGYLEKQFKVTNNTVSLTFKTPHSPQPFSRIPETDSIIQQKNKLLCDKYLEITEPYDNFPDKIKAVQEQAPELFDEILKIAKIKLLNLDYETIMNYLNQNSGGR